MGVPYAVAAPAPLARRAEDLVRQIIVLPPGERLTYWQGRLAEDCKAPSRSRRAAALAAREGAQTAATMGLCLLCQRRHEDGTGYDYLAARVGG